MSDEFNESSVGVLEVKASELANAHRLCSTQPAPLPTLTALADIPAWIKRVKKSLNATDVDTARVAEWIFDNSYLFERALSHIKKDMPANYYTLLPCVQNEPSDIPLPRAYRIASGFLAAGGVQVALPILVKFIKGYQKIKPLDIGELWALPTFLRIVCVELVILAVTRLVANIDSPYKEPIVRQPIEISLEEIDCLGRALHCLANLETIPWQKFFEQVSIVDEELRKDPANAYSKLDQDSRNRYCHAVEKLARATPHTEQRVAQWAVELASRSQSSRPRTSHVGYWLVDDGRGRLETALGYQPAWLERFKRSLWRQNTALYFCSLFIATFALESVAVVYLIANQASLGEVIGGVLLSILPASMIAVSLVNWLVTRVVPPRILNKMDFDKGIDPEFATAVVVPSLLGSHQEIDSLLAQIERHYLCNSDPVLRFVLLTDFLDASTQEMAGDSALVEHMREGIIKLNQKYQRNLGVTQHRDLESGAPEPPSNVSGPFHWLHRQRFYNASEKCWMGWERKRGKLDAFNRLLCNESKSEFSIHEGDPTQLRNLRFVITLDSDTRLFRGAAARLIGTLAHPLNRAVFDDKTEKIIAGYSIVQPRIEIDPSTENNTWFSRLVSGDRVVDIYSRAVSEVYQDLFGSGIFVGKGIYDLSAFNRSVKQRILENSVLSHDCLEGILGRAALASDIVLYEDFPTQYLAFSKRLHRWIRGDWQLLPWLKHQTRIGDDRALKHNLTAIDRWKIIDNIRRSLLSPMLLAWLVASWLWLPGNPLVWTLLALISPIGHNIGNIVFGIVRSANVKHLFESMSEPVGSLGRWLMLIAYLPFEAITAIDAITRTLYRVLISRRNLLQWVSAAHIDKHLHKADPSSHFFFGEKCLAACY